MYRRKTGCFWYKQIISRLFIRNWKDTTERQYVLLGFWVISSSTFYLFHFDKWGEWIVKPPQLGFALLSLRQCDKNETSWGWAVPSLSWFASFSSVNNNSWIPVLEFKQKCSANFSVSVTFSFWHQQYFPFKLLTFCSSLIFYAIFCCCSWDVCYSRFVNLEFIS